MKKIFDHPLFFFTLMIGFPSNDRHRNPVTCQEANQERRTSSEANIGTPRLSHSLSFLQHQLFAPYGQEPKPNTHLIMDYGIIFPDNDKDLLTVKLPSLDPNDVLYKEKVKVLESVELLE